MSHLPERTEKTCLNCGASIHGRFCHICGQENIEPKESFWHLLTHFMYDITHFDGKFFSTIKYLLFRPGFLSHEYLRGRRADYLHPIRMYVFTSAIFFLIFFNLNKEDEIVKVHEISPSATEVMKKLENKKSNLSETLEDSLPVAAKLKIQNAIAETENNIARLKKDSTLKDQIAAGDKSTFTLFNISNRDTTYTNVENYDSVQKTLPPEKRDNFIQRRFAKQNIHLKEKYHNDRSAIFKAIFEKFKHLFPQMLFMSLPLFALLLQLLYVRRKSFFYVNHVVYTIHLYCGTFIIILSGILIEILLGLVNIHKYWIGLVFFLIGSFYWYKSFRNFYEQRRAKTILKYLLVLFFSLFIMIFLFVLFFIFSAMSI